MKVYYISALKKSTIEWPLLKSYKYVIFPIFQAYKHTWNQSIIKYI